MAHVWQHGTCQSYKLRSLITVPMLAVTITHILPVPVRLQQRGPTPVSICMHEAVSHVAHSLPRPRPTHHGRGSAAPPAPAPAGLAVAEPPALCSPPAGMCPQGRTCHRRAGGGEGVRGLDAA